MCVCILQLACSLGVIPFDAARPFPNGRAVEQVEQVEQQAVGAEVQFTELRDEQSDRRNPPASDSPVHLGDSARGPVLPPASLTKCAGVCANRLCCARS